MKKFPRFLFLLIALIACFQFIGIEEAFCKDSAMEAGCQDCMTCVAHQFTVTTDSVLLPGIIISGHAFSSYFFQQTQNPPLTFLRPPITR